MAVLLLIGLVGLAGALTFVSGVAVQFGAGFGLMALGAVLVALAVLLSRGT